MIPGNKKTSLLIQSQLPGFVKEDPDYANFVLFLEAYYEWLEQNNNLTTRSKNLLSYRDIDSTTDEFMNYFVNEFLQYFPAETLISEEQAVKYAKQLYKTKGTPASYKFLFKILYNSDFDYFYTKDAVLKPSDGSWYVAKSVRLATTDPNFLLVDNYRLFGETSKTIATIENSVLNGNRTDVFISNITRLFESGETVRVVDNNNQDVLFNNQPLSAKIIGQVNQVRINPAKRGLLYQVNDPVILYGGLNPNTANPIGAVAEVSEVTTGSIQRVNVINGGFGYRLFNTTYTVTNAPGAILSTGSINPEPILSANVNFIPIDTIAPKQAISLSAANYNFANMVSANANTVLYDAFNFRSFETNPISSVIVNNGSGGISKIPDVTAQSTYLIETTATANLATLGILAPVQVLNPGHGYQANDVIVFTGGGGVGAYANVTSVSNTGGILRVEYVDGPITNRYPKGGIGYSLKYLPAATVQSANANAANAIVYVPGILGMGATFSVITNRTGSVTAIDVLDPGEDYVSPPQVSLRVQDIAVANISLANLPQKGDIVYQGANVNVSTYQATVNSVSSLVFNNDPTQTIWNIRVFDYTSKPNTSLPLIIDRNINMIPSNTAVTPLYNSNGIKTYGDGTAKANATFLNGLVVSQGQYLNSRGHPSSYDVLQSEIYNNYTYIITVEKEIEKYRDILFKLLHPAGMRVLGRYALRANADYFIDAHEAVYQGQPLSYYTGYPGSHAHMYADFTNKSNNIIHFQGLSGANLENFIYPSQSIISIVATNGPNVRADVISVDGASNTVTISSNVWLTYANVAVVSGNASSNVINIKSITNSYNIINNGQYSNTSYPIKDIVYVGDTILVDNNSSRIVSAVDYTNNRIILSSTLSTNVSNSYLSVNRTFLANSSPNSEQIYIYGPVGQIYVPSLVTEDDNQLITESGLELLLG